MAVRTLKIEIHPKPQQRNLLYSMMRTSAEIYNTLIEHLKYKQQLSKQLKGQHPDQKTWEVDPYSDIRRKGWADELIIALTTQQACVYPRQLVNKPAKQGKDKGKERLVIAIKKQVKDVCGIYGIPAQSKGMLCQDFEANIQSYFTHRKNGDPNAQLPKRFKGLHTLFFTKDLTKQNGDRITLGAKPYVLKLRVPELQNATIDGSSTITRSRSGKFYLHVTRKLPVEPNPELTEVAAIDFGQKRAMVLALKDGTTATISGKNILALKRERDGRYREIGRLRSRTFRGQIRQYLTTEEKQTYRRLQEQDNERQKQGKKRRGSDVKYAFRIIRQRRKELRLKRRSNREQLLYVAQNKAADYYRIHLNYANHCVTRAAVDWAVENKVGKFYVGKLDTLPKGRKKGKRRIKQVARNNRWEMPTQVKYLDEKLELVGGEGTEEASEAFSSQTCPSCGRRHKPRNRAFHCKTSKGGCGWKGDRDEVGGVNFLSSVLYGACGNIKPAHNRTLRVAPAIRQGLAMRSPVSVADCDPVEEVAKGHKSSDLQGSDIAQNPVAPKTARRTLAEGKTQGSGGIEGLAPFDTTGSDDTRSQSTTTKTGVIQKKERRSLQKQSENYIQLDFWGSQ